MNKFIRFVRAYYARLPNKRFFWWVVSVVVLAGLYLLARVAEPDSYTVYKELAILFGIDSLLFFFTARTSVKMGTLTLVFLYTMEVVVMIFYLLGIYNATRL